MSGHVPTWLQRLIGGHVRSPGEGTSWWLENSWDWAPWITVLFAAAAVTFILWLYHHERGSAGSLNRTCLALLRIAAIGLVLMMLAEWAISLQRTGLPVLIVAIDDSASLQFTDAYQGEIGQHINRILEAATISPATRINLVKSLLLANEGELLTELSRRYDVRYYTVSDEVRPLADDGIIPMGAIRNLDAIGKSSRLGSGIRELIAMYRGNPPAGILLLTDGNTTAGETLLDVAHLARTKGVPIYTIGLGDDRPLRDLVLADVIVDEAVFAGDAINFDCTVRSTGIAGGTVKLTLRRTGHKEALAHSIIKLSDRVESQQVIVTYRPTNNSTTGNLDFDYTLQLDQLASEVNVKNNERSGRIRIEDKQTAVLLVQAYPNYEYRFLKEALQREKSIKLEVVLQEADSRYAQINDANAPKPVFPITTEELFQYDVIIFGDVNPALLGRSALDNLRDFVMQRGGGIIFIAGDQYTPIAYRATPLESLFPIPLDSLSAPPSNATLTNGFKARPTDQGLAIPPLQIGDSTADTIECWSGLEPLYWMMRASSVKPAARVLASHPTETDAAGQNLPLILIQYVGAGKVVFHTTDETWRWRGTIGDLYFARYWIQMIRYLSRAALSQHASVQITSDRQEYRQDDDVRLRVRFPNDELAPADDNGVSLLVESSDGARKTVVLSRTRGARGLFEGSLTGATAGDYHAWLSRPIIQDDISVDFVVLPRADEAEQHRMNAAELRKAANISQGRFYQVHQLDSLLEDLPTGQHVPISTLPPQPLWNKWPVVLLFLALLTTEWVLRKQAGML